VCLETFRVLISIAALFDHDLRQFDVSAACLHREINGEIYMEPPPGYEQEGIVWLLLKGLYEPKQAVRIWHERLKADMEELGFLQCQRDHAVFPIGDRGSPDWVVWVDNETGVGSRQQLERVSRMFSWKYGISGEGQMRWALGIGVNRDYKAHTISISQKAHINNLMERFGLQNTTTVTTPLELSAIFTKDQYNTRGASGYVW